MVIRIIFQHSQLYDALWQDWINIFENKAHLTNLTNEISTIQNFKRQWEAPTGVAAVIQNYNRWWGEIAAELLERIHNITNLVWRVPYLPCYIIQNAYNTNQAMSDPLTIPILQEKEEFLDFLVHELLHNLFTHNNTILQPVTNRLFADFKGEDPATIYHILVYAVHQKILCDMWGKNRTSALFQTQDISCKRAIEIVMTRGYEQIIDTYFN